MKVMLMPLAMSAIFFRSGIRSYYIERSAKPSRGGGCDSGCGFGRKAIKLRPMDSRGRLSPHDYLGLLRCGNLGRMFRHWDGAFQPRGVPQVQQHLRSGGKTVGGEVEGVVRAFSRKTSSLLQCVN